MSKLLSFLKKIFCKEFPIWAYGLECSVCKMSFGTAELHERHVMEQGTLKKHQGKIPKL